MKRSDLVAFLPRCETVTLQTKVARVFLAVGRPSSGERIKLPRPDAHGRARMPGGKASRLWVEQDGKDDGRSKATLGLLGLRGLAMVARVLPEGS